ncbi:MAG TPA: hypothetical protein PLO78_05690 [Candidatus Omnitrophota bacterium]|nr:hypothetical protein [Candidatus Omnitrophota bacterium]
MKQHVNRGIITLIILLSLVSMGAARRPSDVSSDASSRPLPPVKQTEAYQEYLRTSQNNLAKLVFGLNYFRPLPVILQYEGSEYSMTFCYPLGFAYLMTNYHDEDPVVWIKKHCYRSLVGNQIMYFKFPDGNFRPVRDVFIELFQELEKALKENP